MTLEGKLHLAPIGNDPQRVLDIGTGTGKCLLFVRLFQRRWNETLTDSIGGIWAIDFAE